MQNHNTHTYLFSYLFKTRQSVPLVRGTLLFIFLFINNAGAWTSGSSTHFSEIGGTITPEKENQWQVMTNNGIQNLDMILPPGEQVARLRIKQTIPVLGVRSTTGLDETFSGDDGGRLSPQISYSGLLPGEREKGRLPVELDVTRKSDHSQILGRLRFKLLAGAEVSQVHATTGEGRRYSVYASSQGEAFFGGIARTPDEAVDDAMRQVGDVFPGFRSRYNLQNLTLIPGTKQVTEFRNSQMKYSSFYGAGLVQGDELTFIMEPDVVLPDTEHWNASMDVTVSYE